MTIFKDVPVLATNSPNKLFDTFAAGRPAIVNTDGWQRELVERRRRAVRPPGRPGRPGRAGAASCATTRRSRSGWAQGARRLAEAEFDRRLLAERLRAVLERGGG